VAVYWYIIFRESNAAIPIFWQIFSGWAITNSTIFAATFFKGSKISSIFIAGSFLALAGGAAILVNRYWVPLSNARAVPLSLFFPSMNYIFTLFHLTRFLVAQRLLDMSTGFMHLEDWMEEERYDINTSTFWGLLIIQIFLYPVLAILAERFIHGINTKGRAFTKDQDSSSTAAVEVAGLTKVYSTTWWKKIFFWRRIPELRALDGLDLVAQKRQIMCLLGVNGAGKSTTLDLLSGFMKQTSGSIRINGSGSTPLGICPQKNVLMNELTVLDHVRFWSGVKSGKVVDAEVEEIIAKCGLEEKKHSRAGKLSGGQKRKLQLACMFVGGSLVCLMDEVTTGLDPLSRRTIWDIILAERAKRSIIFTTHFLDEGDVLADHIVILSKGQIKCQGSGAELKTRFGGGYRVHLPHTDSVDKSLGLSPTVHQDRLVYRAEDSRSAAKLVSQLEAAGHKEVQMAGPTIEDVFLNLTKDDLAADEEEATTEPSSDDLSKQLSSGHRTTFWRQVSILLRKRLTVLPRYWMSTLLALVLPIVCVPAINTFVPRNFARPLCRPTNSHNFMNPLQYYSYASLTCDPDNNNNCTSSGADPFGPRSVNDSLYDVLAHYPVGQVNDPYGYQHGFNASTYGYSVDLIDGVDDFKAYVTAHNESLYQGGLYVGDDASPPLIASYSQSTSTTQALLNIWSQVKGGMPIAVSMATMNALAYGVRLSRSSFPPLVKKD
jgi:ATP-binding cassette subfamily A (ABC1) protein 3